MGDFGGDTLGLGRIIVSVKGLKVIIMLSMGHVIFYGEVSIMVGLAYGVEEVESIQHSRT